MPNRAPAPERTAYPWAWIRPEPDTGGSRPKFLQDIFNTSSPAADQKEGGDPCAPKFLERHDGVRHDIDGFRCAPKAIGEWGSRIDVMSSAASGCLFQC
jgi:hypothetical protein